MATNTILLQWQDNSTNEDGFKIYRSTDGIVFTYIDLVNAGIVNYTALGIVSGQNYWFRVTAYNADGESGYTQSGPINCVWEIPSPPSAPTPPSGTGAGGVNARNIVTYNNMRSYSDDI